MGVPMSLSKAVIEVFSFGLLILAIRSRRKAGQAVGGLLYLAPIAIAAFVGLLSGWFSGAAGLEYLLFLRTLISPVVIFFAIININLPDAAIRRIVVLLCFLFLAQIPIVVWKAFVVGIDEKFWIGSFSQTAGQLGLLFPLFALSTLVPLFLLNGGPILAILVFVFSFVPVINEKRAVIFVLPTFFFTAVFICSYFWKWKFALASKLDLFRREICMRFLVLIAIAAVVIYAALNLIPSFKSTELSYYQKENNASATKCVENEICRIFLYSRDYLIRDYYSPLNSSTGTVEETPSIQLGRVALIEAAFERVIKHDPFIMIFGYGASAVNPSYLLGEGRSDVMFEKFGIRGTYPSAIAMLFEAGLVGLSAMVLFFSFLLYSVMKRMVESYSKKYFIFSASVMLMTLTMAFDYFVYSITAWTTYTLSPIYFILVGILLSDHIKIAEHWSMSRCTN